jgi:aspartate/tyrosine/aromatic aminotransferase
VTEDVVDLLTKRYNPKKTYSKNALQIFDKVLHHAEIRPTLLKSKQKLIGSSILIMDPDTMVNELHKLCQSKSLTQLKKNKGMMIIDKLLEQNIINKNEHKQIYKKHFE